MNQDVLDILTQRQAVGGGLFYRPKAASAMGVYAPEVDTAAVSATFVITTSSPDRSEDVIEPSGLDLSNYKKNPVVYYDHGPNAPGGNNPFTKPIGKSKDRQGKLHVKVKAGGVEATCFFSERSWEAMQIFELVDEEILNAASVYCLPIMAKLRTGENGRRGLHITEWEMPEWSIVGVGDNPEAVRKVLDRGKLAGRVIAEPLLKSLTLWAAQPKGLVQGMSIDGIPKAGPPFKKPDDKKEGDEAPPEKKPEAKAPPSDEPTGEQPDEETPVDGDDPEATAETPEAAAETPPPVAQPAGDVSQKPGAVLLSGVHQAISDFTSQLQGQIATQENNAVVSYITNTVAVLGGIAQECQEAYRAAYGMDMQSPQQRQMQGQQTQFPDVPPEDGDQQFVKSLSLHRTKQLAVKGIESRLKRFAEDAALPKDMRDQLRQSAEVLSRLAEQAVAKALPTQESQVEPIAEVPPEVIEARRALTEHRKMLGTLLDEVKSLRPFAKC